MAAVLHGIRTKALGSLCTALARAEPHRCAGFQHGDAASVARAQRLRSKQRLHWYSARSPLAIHFVCNWPLAVPRIQFFAVEIARNREGQNERIFREHQAELEKQKAAEGKADSKANNAAAPAAAAAGASNANATDKAGAAAPAGSASDNASSPAADKPAAAKS